MTVVLEVDGNLVEFPDDASAQAFFANRGGGQPAQPSQPAAPERGLGQIIYDNLVGDPNDGVTSFGERAGTWLNRAGETMTFGLVGDEAAAAATGMLPGRDYDSELERYRANEEGMSGLGRTTADITGAVAGGLGSMLIPGAGPALATAGTTGRAASLPVALGTGAVTGAGMGGVAGFMEGEGGFDERVDDAQTGALVGGGLGLATAGLGRVAQALMDRRAGNRAIMDAARDAPTTEALRAEGRALYGQIDDAGVAIRPDRVRSELDDIAAYLRAEGAGYTGAERVMPGTRSIMEAAGEVGEGSNTIPFRELDVFRRFVGNTAASTPQNPVDARTSAQVIGRLDDFVQRLGPDDVDAGDIETLQAVIPRAREVWSRMSRSQTVDDAITAADNYMSGPVSGLRNQFRRIVGNENLRRGFSEAELDVMRRVAQGTIPERMLYNLGGGLGQIATTVAGGALGGQAGIPGMVGGSVAGAAVSGGINRVGEAVARRNAEIARAVIANGRLPATLPVADEGVRRVVEALALRAGATGPQ